MTTIHAVPFPKIEQVSIREVPPEDSARFLEFVKSQGHYLPLPSLSSAIVAMANGEIIGYGVAQLVAHAEPIFVKPEWRGEGVAELLADGLAAKLEGKPYICIAQNSFASELCRSRGMKSLGVMEVFVRE